MSDIIVGLGEALWDVFGDIRKLGGAPANFAYHVSQFNFDGYAVSAIGNDELGDEILNVFNEKKVNYILPRTDYPTGTVMIVVDNNGVPSYDIKTNAAWDYIPFTDELEQLANKTKVVCFGSLAQRNKHSRATIIKFLDAMPNDGTRLKIFDINLRLDYYTKEIIEESLKRCNILKINDEELEIINKMFQLEYIEIQEQCKKLLDDYKLDMVILTCGTQGSYVFTQDIVSFKETPKVKVADTVGAGDSFTASFCASVLKGKSIAEAHEIAVTVSAYVCTQDGAMPKLPDHLLNR